MQYSSFTRSTLRGLQRPLLQGMSNLVYDSLQTAGRTNADRISHSAHPPHISWGVTVPTTNNVPTRPGALDTYWSPSEPIIAPGSPMRPQFLPLPQMPPTPTPAPFTFAEATSFPSSRAPTPPRTEPVHNTDDTLLCWFASPCGVSLRSGSATSIRQHLAQFHTADIDMHDGRARTRCQWWTTRGPCGREVFCAMLPKHIAGVHLKDSGCVCPRCGRALSRADALVRHLALYCPSRQR